MKGGAQTIYFKNGQLMEESVFKGGKYDGISKRYYSNGTLKAERQYKNGELSGSFKEYYRNGQIKIEGKVKDGALSGVLKRYDEEGRLVYKGNFKDGQNDGPYSRFYPSGAIKETCELKVVNDQEARRDCEQFKDQTGESVSKYYQTLMKINENETTVKTFVDEKMIKEETLNHSSSSLL